MGTVLAVVDDALGCRLAVDFADDLTIVHPFTKTRLASRNLVRRLSLSGESVEETLRIGVCERTPARNVVVMSRNVLTLLAEV